MYELKISVKKVMGECTAEPPMKPGDSFLVKNGDIRIPGGGFLCLWALQSMMPLLTAKERNIVEDRKEDWMWRVHHVQCPDPKGRVIFKIERNGRAGNSSAPAAEPPDAGRHDGEAAENGLKNLRVEVESVHGNCTSGMQPGDYFLLKSGRLYIPPERHFCLYALQACLPMLPARQRELPEGDWMRDERRVLCPDPAGNVILRIDRLG